MSSPSHSSQNATKQLHIDIEEALTDIVFYLDKNSKRKKEFQAFQVTCETKLHKIIKHGSTRWLSLQNCIDRLIKQWKPLQKFFASESREREVYCQQKTLQTEAYQ